MKNTKILQNEIYLLRHIFFFSFYFFLIIDESLYYAPAGC